jgi:aminomethyltransferase
VSLAAEVATLRSSVALSRLDHVTLVRVEGEGALELVQLACTQSPYVREGRVRHALFLREDASVFADVFVVNVDGAFLVVAEGPSEDELIAWLAALAPRVQMTTKVVGLGASMRALGVDGPYAWELIGAVFGPAALGLPYLALMRRDDVLCLRAGKTGEYGYVLLTPRDGGDALEAQLREAGKALDLAEVGREALDVCGLESWHFSMRTLRTSKLATPLTPIELQLQWRVVHSREFVGAEALRARRKEGPRARVTCFTSAAAIAPGARVRLPEDTREIGEVFAACASPTIGATVGIVLLELHWAHPHLTLETNANDELRTCTASLVDNLSLRVRPHKHSYATRAAMEGLPLSGGEAS